ncbi:B2 protein-like [Telopea speciosissima]|uniref:B2 protein-like n=1 Tax=Telopea speciosissima TaxID=54955 RepID=UPI001CC55A3F|nr:B2 protein-like [Telopea speciosissima]XP_043688131.1 B2 protein-like [Telopea speciosissima]XP_043688132.1 B2 protein-like [Telopea speciosissima]
MMDSQRSFWQLGDELRGQSAVASEDQKWLVAASKLAEQTRSKGLRMNNLDPTKTTMDMKPTEKFGFQEDNKFESLNFAMLSSDSKLNEPVNKAGYMNGVYNAKMLYQKGTGNVNVVVGGNLPSTNSNTTKVANNSCKTNNNNYCTNNSSSNSNSNNAVDKRFKTLPSAETLPRNEVLGGYIFVCNNDTMQEDLKRQLFGLPSRYRDSVRAITPGLPLFLYNYATHQLHGIFEAASFGGTNIDPTAWEDKKCKGESRFPAQVRIRVRKLCKALEEDAFRPVLHHYDGPKFRLELSIPETLALLDLCDQGGSD